MSARNITLTMDGPDDMPVLHSELRDPSGFYVHNDLILGTHIENRNGRLVFVD